MLFLNTTLTGLQYGLCYAILAIGLYISYTMLDFADLGVDGIFPLGGVIASIMLANFAMPPILAILIAGIFGAIGGFITGFLHVKCKISSLLCGIIVMTGMLSVTLALTMFLSKTGNTITFFNYVSSDVHGLFNPEFIDNFTITQRRLFNIAILLVIVVVTKVVVDLFLKTKVGFMLRATGNNAQMVISMGKDPGNYKIMGLMIADCLTGISGALYSQLMLQYDNTCGSGKVVIALISVIMGITIFGNIRFFKQTTAVILGSIIYSLALFFFALVDTSGIYLKLFNAAFFAFVLIFSNKYKDLHSKGLKVLFKSKKTIVEGEESNA